MRWIQRGSGKVLQLLFFRSSSVGPNPSQSCFLMGLPFTLEAKSQILPADISALTSGSRTSRTRAHSPLLGNQFRYQRKTPSLLQMKRKKLPLGDSLVSDYSQSASYANANS